MGNYIFIFVMSLFGIGLLKLQKILMPKHYFFYAKLLDGIDEDISLLGAFIRTLMPLLIGLISGSIAIAFQLPASPQHYGFIIGLFSIFLLVWPDILNPELISPIYQRRKGKLYTLYLLVLLAFGLLGAVGGRLANSIYLHHVSILSWVDTKSIVNGLLATSLWTIIAVVIKYYANSFQSSPNKSDQSGTAKRDAEGA